MLIATITASYICRLAKLNLVGDTNRWFSIADPELVQGFEQHRTGARDAGDKNEGRQDSSSGHTGLF